MRSENLSRVSLVTAVTDDEELKETKTATENILTGEPDRSKSESVTDRQATQKWDLCSALMVLFHI